MTGVQQQLNDFRTFTLDGVVQRPLLIFDNSSSIAGSLRGQELRVKAAVCCGIIQWRPIRTVRTHRQRWVSQKRPPNQVDLAESDIRIEVLFCASAVD